MLSWVLSFAVVTGSVGVTQSANTHPNFSGAWTRVSETLTKSPTAKEPISMFSFGPTVAIAQTATALTIATWTLALDGTPQKDREGAMSKAQWAGQTLVLTEEEPAAPGKPASIHKVVLSLDKDGRLSIDITAVPVADVVKLHAVYRK